MPGFDRSRILGISEKDLDEFTCGICQDIFISPLETQCCGQIFCRDCIEKWLRENKSCPSDRKKLDIKDMKSPSRVVTNLLNNMKVKCDFHAKGCTITPTMEQLQQHLISCDKNPNRLCEFCGVNKEASHNCVEAIKREMQLLKDALSVCSINKQPNNLLLNYLIIK